MVFTVAQLVALVSSCDMIIHLQIDWSTDTIESILVMLVGKSEKTRNTQTEVKKVSISYRVNRMLFDIHSALQIQLSRHDKSINHKFIEIMSFYYFGVASF